MCSQGDVDLISIPPIALIEKIEWTESILVLAGEGMRNIFWHPDLGM